MDENFEQKPEEYRRARLTPEMLRELVEVCVSSGDTVKELKEVLEDPRGVLCFVFTPGAKIFVGRGYHKKIYDQNGIDEDGKSLEGRVMKRNGKIEISMYGRTKAFHAVFGPYPLQREVIASCERVVAEKIRDFFGI